MSASGKLRKDSLKSISTDEDGVDSDGSSRYRRALNVEYSLDSYCPNNNFNNSSDEFASFKHNFAEREASSRLAAKRRRIVCALAKQNIEAKFTEQSTRQFACDTDGVATFGMYASTEVQSSGLKLRLTKVAGNDGSRKRKRDC